MSVFRVENLGSEMYDRLASDNEDLRNIISSLKSEISEMCDRLAFEIDDLSETISLLKSILCKIMQFTGQKVEQPASTVCLLVRKCNRLARKMAANMRNAICVQTQTSKVPTQDILLVSSLFCDARC